MRASRCNAADTAASGRQGGPTLAHITKPRGTCFPRRCRLLNGAHFSRVFSKSTRSTDRSFAVSARVALADVETSRLGLAISRKALPRAVDRNRIKRIVRDCFRRATFRCAVDIVVSARAGLRNLPNGEVRSSIEAHFASLNDSLCGARQTAPGLPAQTSHPAP